MSELLTTATDSARREAARQGTVHRLIRNPLGVVALLIIATIVVAAIIGPLVAPFDPHHANLANAFQPPGNGHLLGTDGAGRDIFSRLLVGSRTTLLAAALAVAVAAGIGVPLGLMAGYYGGWLDSVFDWVSNVVLSIPAIIILLAVTAALGKTVWVSMTVFGVLMAPGFYRLTQATVRTVRNELYVDAARVAGLSDFKIISRHILSVVRAPLIIEASVLAGIAIIIQASLGFLGLGDPTVPSWGAMLNAAFLNLYNAPILTLWPGLAITLAIGAFIVLGNALRDALEDTAKAPRRSRKRARAAIQAAPAPRAEGAAAPVAATSDHLLSVSDIRVGYPSADGGVNEVVSGVSFQVDRGQVLGLVGESGSGKTQTAFTILGLLPSEAIVCAGSVYFEQTAVIGDGSRLSDKQMSSLRGRRIAYIPQEPMSNLDPNFTIGHQLARPLVKLLGMSRADAKARALELLATVGIPEPARTFAAYPHQVSGGMAQRVLIAGAVSCDPDLLIADEPTTALDVTVQAEVLDLLRNLQGQLNMGVVLVTHDFGVVADVCDRVVVMRHGRMVETGDVRTILRSPQQAYTQELLAATLHDKEPMTMLTAPFAETSTHQPESDVRTQQETGDLVEKVVP